MKDTVIFDKDSRLLFNGIAYKIMDYNIAKEFDDKTAYLYNDKFYLFKDTVYSDQYKNEPGIYWLSEDNKSPLLIETDDERYNIDGKIGTLNPDEIIKMINNKDVVILDFPEVNQADLPTINIDDDILKRVIKKAMQEKRINIDAYKTRFPDKNALFNFKQVIKGDGKLSMLLFDRAMEAFNLKYTIIIEEANPESIVIGLPIEGTITDSSDAEYNL